ncbi:hypothetical protein [Pseudonocardia nigra]|uniref:hypothetical protein n=1 Tax=Pseudonocardia nigra TaxID=1921578 RepID=UPI001C5F9C8D|nr:hypothetical protein [Pseudonocardia nigra]
MSSRSDVHQLVDQLDEDGLDEAAAVLRRMVQRGSEDRSDRPRRHFRFAGKMSAEPELAARSGAILRDELGRGT